MINEVVKCGLRGWVVSEMDHPILVKRISRHELLQLSLMERRELEALVVFFEVELPRSIETYNDNVLRTVILEHREKERRRRQGVWFSARRKYRQKVKEVSRAVSRTIKLM